MEHLTPAQAAVFRLLRSDGAAQSQALAPGVLDGAAIPAYPANPADQAAPVIPAEEWAGILAAAAELWVHPVVARIAQADAAREAGLPEPVRQRMRLASMAARIRWSRYRRVLRPVFAAWDDQGIPHVTLKGAALLASLVPEGGRLLNDFDVWVPPDRIEEAAQRLEAVGFVRYAVEGGSGIENRRQFHGLVYMRPLGEAQAPLVVDLHERLFAPRDTFRLDPATCATQMHPVDELDGPLRLLGREEQFVHLATQMGTDGRVKLQSAVDLATLVSAGAPSFDFGRLARIARQSRAEGVTALGLRWARALGGRVSPDVVDRMTEADPRCRAACALLFDVRAFLPTHTLAAGSAAAVGSEFVRGRLARARVRVGAVRDIGRRIRRAGGSPATALLHAGRSVPVVLSTWAALRWSRGRPHRTGRIADRLWRSPARDRQRGAAGS